MSRFGDWLQERLSQRVPNGERAVAWLDTTPVSSSDVACELEGLDVSVRVIGLFAEVCETLALYNPNARDLSVALTLPLPDGAQVTGYALDVGGTLVDGVAVRREKARVAFETEQRLGADPGIVEEVRGNVWRTRVYPVTAHGRRSVRVRYVAPLAEDRDGSVTLTLELPEGELAHLHVAVDVLMLDAPAPTIIGIAGEGAHDARGWWHFEHTSEGETARETLKISCGRLPSRFCALERDDEGTVWFQASAQQEPQAPIEVVPIAELTVLWDASGSRAGVDHAREMALVSAYAAASGLRSLRLVSFAERIIDEVVLASPAELASRLEAVRYDGGTNLAAVAEYVSGLHGTCVLVTDGLDTLTTDLFAPATEADLVALVSGTERDYETLAQACHGLAFDLGGAPEDAEELARAIAHARRGRCVAEGSGVADMLDVSGPASSRRTVVGRLVGRNATITWGQGESLVLDATQVHAGGILASAWATRRVRMLSPRASDFADELEDLGRRFKIATPLTSLIVLETLDQWLRHDIEPPESLGELRAAWQRAKDQEMVHVSEAERAARHLDGLRRAWSEVMRWWEAEHGSAEASVAPVPDIWYASAAPGDASGGPDLSAGQVGMPMMSAARSAAMREDSASMPVLDASSPVLADIPAMMLCAEDGSEPLVAEGCASGEDARDQRPVRTVDVRAWMPDAPYLRAIERADAGGEGAARIAYYEQRSDFVRSPSFFLDCASYFIDHGDTEFGLRVLTNLAELKIDDAALLRQMGWRQRVAGALTEALVTMRRVLALRPEDAQSHRDVALVLTDLARERLAKGEEDEARSFAEEAAEHFRTCALTPWPRRAIALALFAVEEHNALRAWADRHDWVREPELPAISEGLEGTCDCDLRVTLAWDADECDVDIHVTEPTGEEAYYGNRRTFIGGRVSEDITDGLGPELYEIRHAPKGTYLIRAHYYASHQQEVFGPATAIVCTYTDWAREGEACELTMRRLDHEREMVEVGTVTIGCPEAADASDGKETGERTGANMSRLALGMTEDEVQELLGEPDELTFDAWYYVLSGGRELYVSFSDGRLTRVVECLPWGERMVVVS